VNARADSGAPGSMRAFACALVGEMRAAVD